MDSIFDERPVLMGIVNLTPDSFFAPSRAGSEEELRLRVEDLLKRGCTILDLGAVSTRPGAAEVSEEEEWRRLEPALSYLKTVIQPAESRTSESRPSESRPAARRNGKFWERFRLSGSLLSADATRNGKSPERLLRISIDTTRSGIVRRVFDAIGPFIVNDISAGEDDPAMLSTVAELGLPYIAMHKRGNPRTMDALTEYPEGVTAAVLEYFEAFSEKAASEGISDWILDPGFGFAKTSEQNWELLHDMQQFRRFGRPVLIGVADKRFTKDPRFNGGDPGLAERMAAEYADILRIH